MLQDDFHAQVSARFGLGRGVVGSEARHEPIDRVKALEARARQAGAGSYAEGVAACFAAVRVLLVAVDA